MSVAELLAPAGNATALHAAVSAGADAVYVGLRSFNARRGAENFTVGAFEEACEYAHLRGVRIYVALNTLVHDSEVSDVIKYARKAYLSGADAFIVQDIGLAYEISRLLPEAHLHISTQMNIHNAAGIRAVARLGAHRVTLARELSIDEIAHLVDIASEWGIEVEIFAHGALCVCYSGQCLFSSMVGCRSANRGMCAQACRLAYTLHCSDSPDSEISTPGDFLLSPKDLSSVDLLGELCSVGVAALKIEGRMKSSEYVYSVTGVYRKLLDRIENLNAADSFDNNTSLQKPSCGSEEQSNKYAVDKHSREKLEVAFSRGLTTAYFEGKRGNEMMSYMRPNNRGQFIGRVQAVEEKYVVISSGCNLVEGDIIEFWTKRGHSALTVRSIFLNDNGLYKIAMDECKHKPRIGDRVFRVRSADAVFVDDKFRPSVPLVGYARLQRGEPLLIEFRPAIQSEIRDKISDDADSDEIRTSLNISRRIEEHFKSGLPYGRSVGEPVEQARTKAVTAEEISEHINRCGGTPFNIIHLDIDLDEDVGIAFSQIHKCRSDALASLSMHMLERSKSRSLEQINPRTLSAPLQPNTTFIAALVSNSDQAQAALLGGAQKLYINALSLFEDDLLLSDYPENSVVVMPAVSHDLCGLSRESLLNINVWDKLKPHSTVVAENLSDIQKCVELGIDFEVGSHVPVINELSLEVIKTFGAKRLWLSFELTLSQIKKLAQKSPVELGITIGGAQELMVCEHCLLMSQGECDRMCLTCDRRKKRYILRDSKGYEFPLTSDILGRSHLYNSVSLDNVAVIGDLIDAGVTSFLIDAQLMSSRETRQAVHRLQKALEIFYTNKGKVDKLPQTTSGHLFRGVS